MIKLYAVLAAAGLALAGCSAPNEPLKETAPPATSSPVDNGPSPDPVVTPTNLPPAEPETTAPPEEPDVAKIGATQWFTYSDGLKVQVTKVARSGKNVIVTVTIRNGTKKTVDLATSQVKMTYGANGNEADPVYDMDMGLGFTGTVTPGRAKTARFGFTVPKNQTVDVEVSPGFLDYESCHFEGSVK
jgi:hypothetical protein